MNERNLPHHPGLSSISSRGCAFTQASSKATLRQCLKEGQHALRYLKCLK